MTALARAECPERSWPGTTATLADLLSACAGHCDLSQVGRAYAAAAAWHQGQVRRSGDPFITHPLAVALILAELKLGTSVVCAALLHDVPDDTPGTVAILRVQFGDEIADLVDAVGRAADPRSFAVCVALGTPFEHQVLMIKLADRLHNMRTLSYIAPAKQQRKSREVLDHFAPLANALGLDQIGAELTGLATAVLSVPGDLVQLVAPRSRRDPGLSRSVLASAVLLLPAHERQRWLEEWTGELGAVSTRRARARFTAQLITGLPRFATALWRPIRAE